MVSNKPERGFTVVETIIVLAISGLILLMVLYLVPTLQRNSRNSSRKNDVTVILDKLASFQLNNSGAMPAVANNFLANARLSYYDRSSISFETSLPSTLTTEITIVSTNSGVAGLNDTNNSPDRIAILNHRRCSEANTAAVSDAAGFRDVVAIYGIETAGGGSSKCIQM